ncbi:MAG: inositol monophosphatase family protein [Victivallaceae bacterium]|jgi:myo-inositol-1(or 4)-monophosphatase
MIEFIKEIARQAGATALEEMKRLDASRVHAKGTDKDMVTEVDRMIEDQLIAAIHSRFPEHDIYGEETGRSGSGSEFCWIIDPIDGTTSYIHQTPYFSISIGLQRNGENIAGAVYAPKLGELFWAEKGRGAFLNGERIRVSPRNVLGQSLVATGFACIRAGLKENNLKYFTRIMPDIRDIRRCGSAAVDLAYVACGRYDGFWEMSLNIYDVAAGVLLVEEAGGTVSDMSGGKSFPEQGIVASNGLIHDKFLSYFKG